MYDQAQEYSVMGQPYKSLFSPHLEYCLPAWNPHYSKNKAIMLERLQLQLRVMTYEA